MYLNYYYFKVSSIIIVYVSYLGSLVQFIYSGLTADDHNVKNAALFAIGQFSEHLQVSISHKLLFKKPNYYFDNLQVFFNHYSRKLLGSVRKYCRHCSNSLTTPSPLMDQTVPRSRGHFTLWRHFAKTWVSPSQLATNISPSGRNLLPYLPGLMDKLFVFLNGDFVSVTIT